MFQFIEHLMGVDNLALSLENNVLSEKMYTNYIYKARFMFEIENRSIIIKLYHFI